MPYAFYTDGGSYTIAGSYPPAYVSGATTISFSASAALAGDASVLTPSPEPGLHGVFSTGSVLVFASGSAFTGGADTANGLGEGAGDGINSADDDFTATAGSGPTATGGAGHWEAGNGLAVSNPSALALTAGSYTGGASVREAGGAGILIGLSTGVSVTLGGSNLYAAGGSGTSQGPALEASVSSGSALTVVGGHYSGPIQINASTGGSVTFTGSGLSFSAGTLTGTLTDGTAISNTVTLGSGVTASGSGASVTFAAPAMVLVQHAYGISTSGTAPTATFTNPIATGNTVIAKVCYLNAGGTLTMPAGFTNDVALNPVGPHVSIWSFPAAAIASGTTVTGSLSGSSTRSIMVLEEWSGILLASPLDKTASALTASSGTGASGTTAATTHANEMAAVAIACDTTAGGVGVSTDWSGATNSYTLDQQINNNIALGMATLYKTLTTTGAQSTDVNNSQTPSYSGVIATYKASI